jgi:hypothetical protein
MFLQTKDHGVLVEVMDTTELIDPLKPTISGRIQAGQEEQDPEEFAKGDLVFPSGEMLPQCWLDADYQSRN